MLITQIDKTKKPVENPHGESIYELVGPPDALGNATKHSFGYVTISPNGHSEMHFHPEDEETYIILKGNATMVIDGKEHSVNQGDIIFIKPPEVHQIFNNNPDELQFYVICAPAWTPENSIFPSGEK